MRGTKHTGGRDRTRADSHPTSSCSLPNLSPEALVFLETSLFSYFEREYVSGPAESGILCTPFPPPARPPHATLTHLRNLRSPPQLDRKTPHPPLLPRLPKIHPDLLHPLPLPPPPLPLRPSQPQHDRPPPPASARSLDRDLGRPAAAEQKPRPADEGRGAEGCRPGEGRGRDHGGRVGDSRRGD